MSEQVPYPPTVRRASLSVHYMRRQTEASRSKSSNTKYHGEHQVVLQKEQRQEKHGTSSSQTPSQEDAPNKAIHDSLSHASLRRYSHPPLPLETQVYEGLAPPPVFSFNRLLVIFSLSLLCSTIVAILFLSYALPAFEQWHDSILYSYPRTYQTDASIGQGGKSHILALNSHGVIEVLVIPLHSDKAAIRIYLVTTIVGNTPDLTPITNINFVNDNGRVDMEVEVNSITYFL